MHCEKGELLTDITTMIDKSMLRQGHPRREWYLSDGDK